MVTVAGLVWVALTDAWFQGPLLGGRVGPAAALLPAALLLALMGRELARRFRSGERPGPLALAILACAAAATLVRLPALAAPFGLISSDSAVAGIIAQDLRRGVLPAPIYAPGFPYEGTLKPHLTAVLGVLLPGTGTPLLYAVVAHLFHLVWVAAVMLLAHGAAGGPAAWVAGLYMALSPRFLTAFSLNNVGQYPEVNALGALALALLARAGSPAALAAAGFVLGLAVWQQLLGVYFVMTVVAAVLTTPAWRTPRAAGALTGGFAAGAYPMFVWNARSGWATFDFFRRGGKNPLDRVTGAPEQLEKTLTVSFPKLLGATDLDLPAAVGTALAVAAFALVFGLAWRERAALRERRAAHPVALAALLFVVVVGTFVVSKFSHRGLARPRYLMPTYTSIAVALGVAFDAARGRRPALAAAGAAAVLGFNLLGLAPWLAERRQTHEREEALLRRLDELGIRRAYAGYWIAAKYTFLAEGRDLVISGELPPEASWMHFPHSDAVHLHGPDAYIVRDDLAPRLAARLESLGCRFRTTPLAPLADQVVFHDLDPRVPIEQVRGYEGDAGPAADPGEG